MMGELRVRFNAEARLGFLAAIKTFRRPRSQRPSHFAILI